MRFLALLNLFLYVMLSLHAAFDGHVQVLCIEKDGHIEIETFDLSQMMADARAHNNSSDQHVCPDRPGECSDCTDYYIGNGHPDTLGVWHSINPNLQALDSLYQLPSLVAEPFVTAWAPAPPPDHPPLPLPDASLVHIPSTVLLI